jgi:hypothetical protein
LCGYKTWSFTLGEGHEHRFRAFENRVIKRIFGCKRKEVTGGWRRVQKKGFKI